MVAYDPYLNWLGIAPHEQPPNFYRLLGLVLFESNPQVIEHAADLQSLRVGAFQAGPQGEMCQQLLSEIAIARFCLLDPQQKTAYDRQLQESLSHRGERAVAAPPPPAPSAGAAVFASPPPQFAPQAGTGPIQPGLEQTIAYDAHFQERLSQRGERAVAAPPPPASLAGARPFAPPSPQYGPQGGVGPIPPGSAGQGPMILPGPPPPMQPPMPGPAAMPMPQQPQPIMQMPPTMMPAPAGFATAMPYPAAPAALPAAMPFPAPRATAAVATPATPPVAPLRPIDELESLTSQSTFRHRFLKKKKNADYTREFVIGGLVATAGVVLLVVYIAVKSQDPSDHGYGGIKPEKPVESIGAKLAEEHQQKLKEIEKEKEKAKDKGKAKDPPAAADHAAADNGDISPLRPFGQDVKRHKKRSPVADDADAPLATPYSFGPPRRAMDAPAADAPVEAAPPDGHDTPRDLGGPKDPVMETPKPEP